MNYTGPDHEEEECDDRFPVLEDNLETIEAFLQVQTQWRTSLNGIVGLDYAAVELTCRLAGIELDDALFKNLQIMERAIIRATEETR